ncbi:GGDEF domain-containing protein [Nocardioides sp. CER19]|uniref:GGDEF domain-containing protein n=1 Tax=Nocardioides sp. CER19 TaxID=3038538 RepID=UPI00244D6E67|nr:GGDEF domain-containing protein [Nocardioides sp. CER19]MDH2415589.1 GGDEF domain-containing protein [Nocardioides sp. CER19]
MLDTVTLRVAFGLIALCGLVLFYAAAYRPTRSAFSGWWVLSLLCFLCSSSLFLSDNTSLQAVGEPLGKMFSVLGSACVWAAASSMRETMRDRRLPATWMVVPPVVVLLIALLDDPADKVWGGGAALLAGMTGYFALSARDMWLTWHERPVGGRRDAAYDAAVISMTALSVLVAAFYLLRLLLFVAFGPDSQVFEKVVGSQPTTLALMLLLVTVTFNMSSLSQAQLTRELQVAASQDPLTGLLNRAAFRQRVEELMTSAHRRAVCGYLVMSDFDDFKLLNDHYGHATGDAVLTAFGAACTAELRQRDLAARIGGDEFVLLLEERSDRRPEDVLQAVNKRLEAGAARGAHPLPTVSFGISELDPKDGLDACLARADAALYRAKGSGFGAVVRAD